MTGFCRILLFFLVMLADVGCLWAVSTRSLVLATSASSNLPALTTQEARKLFLGVPLENEGKPLVPLLNISDPVTYQIFLQKVAFMSANVFESQTISVVFRLGGKRPQSYEDVGELITVLKQNPGTVTFLWDDQVKANQGIKTVSVLWQGWLE